MTYLSSRSTLLLSIVVFLSICCHAQDSVRSSRFDLPSKDSLTVDDAVYGENAIETYNNAYFVLGRINKSIGLPPNKYNLQTPQAALEHFIINCRNNDFKAASYALNFNLLPDKITEEDAIELAKKLYFVINQRIDIDWGGLSDRPDGQTDMSTTTNKAIAGKPRRSIVFGEIELGDRDVVLRLDRVKYKENGAFWVIAANSVENIDGLYAEYGPRKLDRLMPDWGRIEFLGLSIWKFVGSLILLVLAYFVWRLCIYLIGFFGKKFRDHWMASSIGKLKKPAAFCISVLFFYVLLNSLISFNGPFAGIIYTLLLAVVVISFTWFVMRLLDAIMLQVAENNVGDTTLEENEESRKMLTYISVARRIITFLVIIVGASIILSQFKSLEKLGISLLASAGLATVVLGIAAQSTLGNIIAGIQIAVTKPLRIGDTVIFQEQWGYVEDIRFTYLVMRTWDHRRLIIPLKLIISNIFENWSITSPNLIKPIELYADYRVDVVKVRAKFKELLEASEDWDEEKPPMVQVTEVTEKSIKIRALCSAKNASVAWDLHCELREKMVRFISDLEDGQYLSKSRLRLDRES